MKVDKENQKLGVLEQIQGGQTRLFKLEKL